MAWPMPALLTVGALALVCVLLGALLTVSLLKTQIVPVHVAPMSWTPPSPPSPSSSPLPLQHVVAIDQNAGGAPPETYPQIGYVIVAESGRRLPLYGMRSVARRDRWYYYTIIGGGIKVPVVSEKRDCMEEVGCGELHDGESVRLPDEDMDATVRLYKMHTRN